MQRYMIWNDIDWYILQRDLYILQRDIYKYSKEGNEQKVFDLQEKKLLKVKILNISR